MDQHDVSAEAISRAIATIEIERGEQVFMELEPVPGSRDKRRATERVSAMPWIRTP